MKRIAILASADGLNADRLVEEFHDGNRVRIDIVLTDREDAGVIRRLEQRGVPVTFFPPEVWNGQPVQIIELLEARKIDLVVLDGFGQPVPELLASRFAGRLLSVDPTQPESEISRTVLAALRELPTAEDASDPSPASVPPPVPVSADREWARRLGVPYNPEKVAEVPHPVPADTRTYATAPVQARNNPQTPQDMPPMPPNYLLWSVLALVFCCMIPAIVALIFSAQVSSRYYRGDIEGSRRASRMAEIWIIVSFVLGVLSATLYVPLMLIN